MMGLMTTPMEIIIMMEVTIMPMKVIFITMTTINMGLLSIAVRALSLMPLPQMHKESPTSSKVTTCGGVSVDLLSGSTALTRS